MFDLCFFIFGYVDYFKYVYVYGMCMLMFVNEIKNKKMFYLIKDFCNKI